MNRDQRKTLEKLYRKKGKSRFESKQIAQQMYDIDRIRLKGVGEPSVSQNFSDGEKFKLDVEKIKARKNYESMTENYKTFVTDNADTIFTAHVERRNLISAAEEPKWLFWSGDLIKIKQVNNMDSDNEDGVTINVSDITQDFN